MKRSQLKTIANKTGKDNNPPNLRKQRNQIVNLNKKEKKKFLNSLSTKNHSKPFWETCKPYFSDRGIKTSWDIILSDKEGLILKEVAVARELDKRFQSITSSLGFSNGLTHLILQMNKTQSEVLLINTKTTPAQRKSRANKLQLNLFLSDQLLSRMSLMLFLH